MLGVTDKIYVHSCISPSIPGLCSAMLKFWEKKKLSDNTAKLFTLLPFPQNIQH